MPATPQPGFFVDRQYLKDLSFENPAGPQVIEDRSEIKTSVGGAISSHALDEGERFQVDTTLTITASFRGRTIFLCELTYVAEVELTQVPAAVREQILSVDVPNYLMPQINTVIDHAAKAGGFSELRIRNIDFLALYHQARRRQASSGAGTH